MYDPLRVVGKVAVILCGLFFAQSFAQSTQSAKLPQEQILSLAEFVKSEALLTVLWDSIYKHGMASVRTKSSAEAKLDIALWIERPSPGEPKFYAMERRLAKKYSQAITTVLENLILIEGDWAKFVYFDNSIPARFATKNGVTVITISGVVAKNVFNTINTTAKERAGKIIGTTILPSLRAIYKEVSKTDMKYFGMSAVYGSRNFLKENDDPDLESEVTVLVVAVDSYRKLANLQITENELLNTADIFLYARETRQMQKINLITE